MKAVVWVRDLRLSFKYNLRIWVIIVGLILSCKAKDYGKELGLICKENNYRNV
jgi:hypothetical protein